MRQIPCRQQHKCRRMLCLTLLSHLSVCLQLAFKILADTDVGHTSLACRLLIILLWSPDLLIEAWFLEFWDLTQLQIMQEMFTLTSEMWIKCLHFQLLIDPVARIPHGTFRMALPWVVHPAHEFLCSVRVTSTILQKNVVARALFEKTNVACDSFNSQEFHSRQLKVRSFPLVWAVLS